MTLDLAESILRKHLEPYFDHKNYVEKQPLIYERQTRFGSSVVIATVTGDDEMTYVKLFVGIRHHLVELTLTNTFGLDDYFKNSSFTLLVHWKNLDPEVVTAAMPCREYSDIKAVGDMIIDFMDRKGFDFLNHYKHLSNLDRLFNDRFDTIAKWNNHNYLTAFRAMAIAKLSDRNDYDRLFTKHYGYLDSRGLSGPIIEKYSSTFAYLKKLSLN
jgi:hypothetical protein